MSKLLCSHEVLDRMSIGSRSHQCRFCGGQFSISEDAPASSHACYAGDPHRYTATPMTSEGSTIFCERCGRGPVR